MILSALFAVAGLLALLTGADTYWTLAFAFACLVGAVVAFVRAEP